MIFDYKVFHQFFYFQIVVFPVIWHWYEFHQLLIQPLDNNKEPLIVIVWSHVLKLLQDQINILCDTMFHVKAQLFVIITSRDIEIF